MNAILKLQGGLHIVSAVGAAYQSVSQSVGTFVRRLLKLNFTEAPPTGRHTQEV